MASFEISNVAQPSTTQASAARSVPAQTENRQAASVDLKPDTVKLSVTAQAIMMHRAGQSAGIIAASLGTSVAFVDGYLGIAVAKQVVATPVSQPAAEASLAETAPAQPSPAVVAPIKS